MVAASSPDTNRPHFPAGPRVRPARLPLGAYAQTVPQGRARTLRVPPLLLLPPARWFAPYPGERIRDEKEQLLNSLRRPLRSLLSHWRAHRDRQKGDGRRSQYNCACATALK